MTQPIDTPYGSYLPEVPSPAEMESAATVMADAVEAITELNHDVWLAKRIDEGWHYGPQRDDEQKYHPCLVAYAHLPESEKAYDRDSARAVIAALLRRGLIERGQR